MKKILVTGKGSYIGTHFIEELSKYPDDYAIDELEMRDDSWKEHDFSQYDVVYHVAGIAHIKEIPENEHLYSEVNCDLAVEVAKKAKVAGVRQLIFMSSMSVYGLISLKEPITKDTQCKPNTFYGKSKYQAEKKLEELEDNSFKICILRPPMVYGDNAPGNLGRLFNAVKKVHVFPTIKNARSSITVEKLIQNVKMYVDNEVSGIFCPQNDTYMCTFEIVKEKMKAEGVKVYYTSLFNPLIRFLIGKVELITKCFGDLKYE